MQEPIRLNLLNVLQRSLKCVEKKTYVHRLIYIGDYKVTTQQDQRLMQLIFESNIKLINDEFADVPLTGFGLFYVGYFINIIESSEECIVKHLKTLCDSLNENVSNSPTLNRMKILIISHHIKKRNFFNWFGRPAKPPVLLDKIEASNSEETIRQIDICIKKLYKMSEYLRSQPMGLIRATMDNISELCHKYLPEVNLLDFLLDSPALLNASETIASLGTVPDPKFIEESIWPVATDFVPYAIVGKDQTKLLMYTPKTDEDKPKISEDEVVEEERDTENPTESLHSQ